MPKKAIWFATTNKGKVASLDRALAPRGIRVLHEYMELPEPQELDLKLIVAEKLLAAHQKIKQPVLAQDTGFFIPSWGGFPGPFVKFALQTIGLDGFIDLAAARERNCEFRECLGYSDGYANRYFEAVIPGTIAFSRKGTVREDSWSELDLIFIPEGQTKTLGEMNEDERARWRASRGNNSAQNFAEWAVAEYAQD